MTTNRYFTTRTFAFLRDLRANNDRAWFQVNKDRYEADVRDPALRFITDFELPLRKISRHFTAEPRASGGSLFRIYRDTRFSHDKTPYKTYTGIHFRHEEAKDAHAPGFYLHLEPGAVFAGAGIWRPDGSALRVIRNAIVDEPKAWLKARNAAGFRERFEISGESLKRPPRGYDPEHPQVEDLKRKDFIGIVKLTQGDVTGTDLLERFTTLCRSAAPYQRFLCRALGVEY